MDPHANMEEQRTLASKIIESRNPLGEPIAAERLAELVVALDEWRMNGGFDPYASSTSLTFFAQAYLRETAEGQGADTNDDTVKTWIEVEGDALASHLATAVQGYMSNAVEQVPHPEEEN